MKCTTYEQLHLEMARVYKMCVGTVFEGRECECTKHQGYVLAGPTSPENYEFALGIVEDRAVWCGDELHIRGTPMKITSSGQLSSLGWSWNPPAPPKPKTVSISVNGGEPIEFVLPNGCATEKRIGAIVNIAHVDYGFEFHQDAHNIMRFLQNLLEGKL